MESLAALPPTRYPIRWSFFGCCASPTETFARKKVASKNLDSAEKFYLGGASGVRAYPSSEGGGAEGQLASLELRARLPQNFALSAFYDWGHVTVNRNNGFTGASALNAYTLQGAGLTAAWFASFGLNLKATWARRSNCLASQAF